MNTTNWFTEKEIELLKENRKNAKPENLNERLSYDMSYLPSEKEIDMMFNEMVLGISENNTN